MGRLVLTRKTDEGITIFNEDGTYFGDINIVRVVGATSKIVTTLPDNFRIIRNELLTADQVVEASQAKAFIIRKRINKQPKKG